jgi:CRP-like cAMP-binding protein
MEAPVSHVYVDPRLASLPQCRSRTRRQLERATHYQTYLEVEAGTILIRRGDSSGQVALILSGVASITDDRGGFAVLGPGDLAGATSITGHQALASTVRAETDLALVVMTRDEFREVLALIPTLVPEAHGMTDALTEPGAVVHA